MKIYTKTGDKGITSLTGGKRIAKNNIQVESYGCIDELNAIIGFLISQEIKEYDKNFLVNIQRSLFKIGNYISSDYSVKSVSEIKSKDISFLEKEIDKISAELEPLKKFILPGGNQAVTVCHMARTVCRRTERVLISLNDIKIMDNNIIIYLNRLSDYLFVLSRKIAKDFGIKEVLI